jgi:cysteinyl-tRNA synthetase
VIQKRGQRAAGGVREARDGSAADLLAQARSWGYQLQDLDIARAAQSPFDVLVVDYAKDGSDETALRPAEVARLQKKADGSRRLVLAYLSIGEAESYRSYWQPEWKRKKPAWLLGENPDWEENYAVCFWEPGWQALLCGRPDAYLDRILAQGFDGIYLDKCDVTEDLKRLERKAAASRSDLEGDMVRLVQQLAAYARQARPGFLVVMQNAEPLLERAELRRTIDAVAKEELLYGLDASEKANARDEVDWSCERLDLMRRDGKPVFVVEYLDDHAKIAHSARRVRELGYVLYVSAKNRELDRLRDTAIEA